MVKTVVDTTDVGRELFVEVNMMYDEAPVNCIGGAVKSVGNGCIDGRPSVSRRVTTSWRCVSAKFRCLSLRRQVQYEIDRLQHTPTVPGTVFGTSVVAGYWVITAPFSNGLRKEGVVVSFLAGLIVARGYA